jgi:hypothetical protein
VQLPLGTFAIIRSFLIPCWLPGLYVCLEWTLVSPDQPDAYINFLSEADGDQAREEFWLAFLLSLAQPFNVFLSSAIFIQESSTRDLVQRRYTVST